MQARVADAAPAAPQASLPTAARAASLCLRPGPGSANPTAVLRATGDTGNQTSALLKLSDPHFNATRRTLTFKARPAMCPNHARAMPQEGLKYQG